MKATKKVLCMLLAAIFAVSVFAGCKGNGTTTSSAAGTDTSSAADSKKPGKVDTTEAVTFTLMFGEHATELYHMGNYSLGQRKVQCRPGNHCCSCQRLGNQAEHDNLQPGYS